MLFTGYFWKASFERAVKSAAQTSALFFTAGATEVLSVPAEQVLYAALGGAVLSLLTSLASLKVGPNKGDPSAL